MRDPALEARIPKTLPVLVIQGELDPVGENLVGTRRLVDPPERRLTVTAPPISSSSPSTSSPDSPPWSHPPPRDRLVAKYERGHPVTVGGRTTSYLLIF